MAKTFGSFLFMMQINHSYSPAFPVRRFAILEFRAHARLMRYLAKQSGADGGDADTRDAETEIFEAEFCD